jgi:phospholipid transport system substrate-binding protein
MRQLYVLLLLPMIAGANLGPVHAEVLSPDGAESFINNVITKVLHTIRDENITDEKREQSTAALLQEDFAISQISRFVLGQYYTSGTADDLRSFDRLFVEWIVKSYSTQLQGLVADDIKVTAGRMEGSKDTVVTTAFHDTDGDLPTKVEWRVRANEDGYKIVDIEVEGVSMLLTEKDEVASVIKHSGGTIADLNRLLDLKLHAGSAAPQVLSGL